MAKGLTRDARRGVIAGVAAGFADYFDVDPVLVRLIFVLLTFLHGAGALFYLVCWVVMPKSEAAGPAAETPPAETVIDVAPGGSTAASPAGRGRVVAGTILIVLGTLFLLHQLDWLHWPHWLRWSLLWPAAVIAIGLGVILSAFRGRG